MASLTNAQRAAAIRMLKLYGRKGELKLVSRQKPVEKRKPRVVTQPSVSTCSREEETASVIVAKHRPTPPSNQKKRLKKYSVRRAPSPHRNPYRVANRLAPSEEQLPDVPTRVSTDLKSYHGTGLDSLKSPSITTESSMAAQKHKRRRRRAVHTYKRKRVVRKSPGTPPPYVAEVERTGGACSQQSTLKRGLKDWLRWRLSLNEHLASHVLSENRRDVKALPVRSILETMDRESLKAIFELAYKRDNHVSSLSQIAYVVYGIPRVHINPREGQCGSLQMPSEDSGSSAEDKPDSREHPAAKVRYDVTTSTVVSHSSQDSIEHFDPHYHLLKIYQENKWKEDARLCPRKQPQGWAPSVQEVAMARSHLAHVQSPCEGQLGSIRGPTGPPLPPPRRQARAFVSRLNFTDVTDEFESPGYYSTNAYSSSSRPSDYNTPLYRPTTALLRSIRTDPLKPVAPLHSPPHVFTHPEESKYVDDSIYLFRPQMARSDSEHLPVPYRQRNDGSFFLLPHQRNQRQPSHCDPTEVPPMYRQRHSWYMPSASCHHFQ